MQQAAGQGLRATNYKQHNLTDDDVGDWWRNWNTRSITSKVSIYRGSLPPFLYCTCSVVLHCWKKMPSKFKVRFDETQHNAVFRLFHHLECCYSYSLRMLGQYCRQPGTFTSLSISNLPISTLISHVIHSNFRTLFFIVVISFHYPVKYWSKTLIIRQYVQ